MLLNSSSTMQNFLWFLFKKTRYHPYVNIFFVIWLPELIGMFKVKCYTIVVALSICISGYAIIDVLSFSADLEMPAEMFCLSKKYVRKIQFWNYSLDGSAEWLIFPSSFFKLLLASERFLKRKRGKLKNLELFASLGKSLFFWYSI